MTVSLSDATLDSEAPATADDVVGQSTPGAYVHVQSAGKLSDCARRVARALQPSKPRAGRSTR